jgi:hypothetical protein
MKGMNKYAVIAMKVHNDNWIKRVNQERHDIEHKLSAMENIIEAEARVGHFATVFYEYQADVHWLFNRPKRPDHRWDGLLEMQAKAHRLGLKTEVVCKSHTYMPDEIKLIISCR